MKLASFGWFSGFSAYARVSAAIGRIRLDEAELDALDAAADAIVDEVGVAFPLVSSPLRELREESEEPDFSQALGLVTAALCNLLESKSRALRISHEDGDVLVFGATCPDYRVGPRLALAFDLIAACVAKERGRSRLIADANEKLTVLMEHIQTQTLGIDSRAIVNAAEKRNIPWNRVRYRQSFAMFQLGWGQASVRFNGTRTVHSSYWGCRLSHDKVATAQALKQFGLPVAQQHIVTSGPEARRAAKALGYPVVVKPLRGAFGRGVSTGLNDDQQVQAAFDDACRRSGQVIVESTLAGEDYRFFVVNQRVRAVSKKRQAQVVGDGRSRVEDLISQLNADPRRTDDRHGLLRKVQVDSDTLRMLSEQGLTLASVPVKGDVVLLKSVHNRHAGGSTTDVLHLAHPDNIDAAIAAANILGLDLAGVDFLLPDVAKSWKETGGGICEVNDQPGFTGHTVSHDEQPVDYGELVLDEVFGTHSDGRIPVVGIVGREVAHLMSDIVAQLRVRRIRLSHLVDRNPLHPRVDEYADWAASVLQDPNSAVGVLAVPPEAIWSCGLGFDRADLILFVDDVPDIRRRSIWYAASSCVAEIRESRLWLTQRDGRSESEPVGPASHDSVVRFVVEYLADKYGETTER